MKIIKYIGNSDGSTYNLQGIKTVYDDGVKRNDLQTVMAVINWQAYVEPEYLRRIWTFGNGQPILFGDSRKVMISKTKTN